MSASRGRPWAISSAARVSRTIWLGVTSSIAGSGSSLPSSACAPSRSPRSICTWARTEVDDRVGNAPGGIDRQRDVRVGLRRRELAEAPEDERPEGREARERKARAARASVRDARFDVLPGRAEAPRRG